MSQDFEPLNGGRADIVLGAGGSQGYLLSKQYTAVKKIAPRDTEWIGGRPIYDRLPSASQRYKLNFGYDQGTAYTYIPMGEGYTGSSSMAVQPSGENKFLTVQAGKIVWEYGTIDTDPVIIDLEQVGIGSAKYLLAYQLYYDDSEQNYQYQVRDYPLLGSEMLIESGTDSVKGWRYTPQYAFIGQPDRYWTTRDGFFPEDTPSPFLSWQTPLPQSLSELTLRCPAKTAYSGEASLFYLTCPSEGSSPYCDNPVWVYGETTSISSDELGQFFKFSVESPITSTGWKVVWSSGEMSINNVFVSGVVTRKRKPATTTTNYSLVAYPLNAIPDKFTNSEGEEVPLVLCKLAYVDINSSFTVLDIKDIREVVYNSYEPVAEWLTRPWDDNLRSMYDQVSNYTENWLTPQSCMLQEYESLANFSINVTAGS